MQRILLKTEKKKIKLRQRGLSNRLRYSCSVHHGYVINDLKYRTPTLTLKVWYNFLFNNPANYRGRGIVSERYDER